MSKLFSTDIWKPMPLVSKEQKQMGLAGGEGCQFCTFIKFSATEKNVAWLGVDVGGSYKSVDGGKTWYPNTLGLKSGGMTGIADDPKCSSRVLSVGCNSSADVVNGIYLSTDTGETWTPVFYMRVKGNRDYRRQIAFDETSFDPARGYCTRAYWSSETTEHHDGRLYVTNDGGETWSEIENSLDYGTSNITVSPKTGVLYIANKNGLFAYDGTFAKLSDMYVCYIDRIPSRPTVIYLATTEGLFEFDTEKVTFTRIDESGFPTEYPQFLTVSDKNPELMVVQNDALSKRGSYTNVKYYSADGGKTWRESQHDYSKSYIPYNSRPSVMSFNCEDAKTVISLGGDFVMRSTDGGASFEMSNDGNNGHCTGGKVGWNLNNPDCVAIGSQDYNGSFSTDNGNTWTYVNWASEEWGGMNYGSYCFNEKDVVSAYSKDGWRGSKMFYPIELVVTHDGGKTVEYTGNMMYGVRKAVSIIGKPDAAVYGEWKTTDCGYTWKKMEGTLGAYTVDVDNGYLYGVNKVDNCFAVVYSADEGESWQELFRMGGTPADMTVGWHELFRMGKVPVDMAINRLTGELFIACGSLFKYNTRTGGDLERVDVPISVVKGVGIDDNRPDVMYVTGGPWPDYDYKCVVRSLDGGKTWVSLNMDKNDFRKGVDGGKNADNPVVNPVTHELVVVCGCRGLWKIAAPYTEE